MATRPTAGNAAQFTYDFGIMIAQSTVNKMIRLTGATLSLASAYYALQTTGEKYVKTLRENALRFGGILSTMKAMEDAQNRLVKGQSYFEVDDQLRGLNSLMAVGVKVGKNFEFINKAAHATGKTYSEFASAISQGIQGNMQGLVDMGLLTQRSTRYFEKYRGNTIQRQQAILNFVKEHKGLQELIKNDFLTIQDQIRRLRASMTGFIQSIVGKPNNPNSLYGQTTKALQSIADALGRNYNSIVQYGKGIGMVLGWVVRQIGHVMVWLGGQTKKAINYIFGTSETFVERMRSLIVVLEFWKVKLVSLFREYKEEIKTVLKLLIAYQLVKTAFVISKAAISSVKAYSAAMMGIPVLGKSKTLGKWFTNFGSRLKLVTRIAFTTGFIAALDTLWVIIKGTFTGKFIAAIGKVFKGIGPMMAAISGVISRGLLFVVSIVKNLPAIIGAVINALRVGFVALNATNPVGWIILAITLVGVLYYKFKGFRDFVNSFFKFVVSYLKLVWNSIAWLYVQIRIGFIKVKNWFSEYVWTPIASFFDSLGGWISDMWTKFKDTSVGKWVDKWIVSPINTVIKTISELWNKLKMGLGNVYGWITGASNNVAESAKDAASQYGFSAPVINSPTNTKSSTISPENANNPMPTTVPSNKGGNPIIPNGKQMPIPQNEFSTESQSMILQSGAIQINVNGGQFDERKLAYEVKRILNDIQRDLKVRGGA